MISVNLTGGGARGSYQAGVLLALGEILGKEKLLGKRNPLQIWSGSSAGAINAAYCASQSENLHETTRKLAQLWREITPDQVYRTDLISLSGNSAKWIRDLTFGPMFKQKLSHYLLDTQPLLELIEKNIPFNKIDECIKNNFISSLTCSSYCYNNAKTVSFVQSPESISWDRARRISQATLINARHILASCSIPLLFPATRIGDEYYGDGAFRNTTPISPSLHLGAKKILMVGVRAKTDEPTYIEFESEPGIAKVAGSMLNALFFDTLDIDLERINHINEIIKALKKDVVTQRSDYSVIDYKIIRPSEDITKIAEQKSKKAFPKVIEFLLSGLGSKTDTADLSSYILFEPSFTSELIDLGYYDLLKQKDDILQWLNVS